MFCWKTSMDNLNNIHEKCLRLVTNDNDLNFNKLLESSHELSIHVTCINYLVYKNLHGMSPKLMTDIFTPRRNPYNIRNIRLFISENPRSVHFGVDAIAFRARKLRQKVPMAIKDPSSLEIFKAKIKLWSYVKFRNVMDCNFFFLILVDVYW